MAKFIEDTIEENRRLIKEYPFLQPRNVWTDKIDDEYDYSYTLADDCPEGWREIFLKMCADIKPMLVDAGFLDDFRFSQIKEKFGTLRAYCFMAPRNVLERINQAEHESAHTCIHCGRQARFITKGWIYPFCEKCIDPDLKLNEDYVEIEDYLDELKEDEV